MSDKMREEFEAWGKNQYDELWPELCCRTKANLFDCYRDAWQASRAALVVELPDSWDSNTGIESYSSDVRSALDEAGVKYNEQN